MDPYFGQIQLRNKKFACWQSIKVKFCREIETVYYNKNKTTKTSTCRPKNAASYFNGVFYFVNSIQLSKILYYWAEFLKSGAKGSLLLRHKYVNV